MTRPNILFLMADQMQGRVLEPDHVCQTPNLDKMAARGVRFTQAYTPNNICSPSRASLMTGLMPHNHGVLEVLYPRVPDLHVLRTEKPHWAQSLIEAGYRTGYFGKWHIERSNQLDQFGWQVDGGHSGSLFRTFEEEALGDLPMEPPPVEADDRLYIPSIPPCDLVRYLDEPDGYGPFPFYGVTDRPAEERSMGVTTSMALRFLKEEQERAEERDNPDPWCCFVSFVEPHDPFIAQREFFDRYADRDLPPPANANDDLADRPGLYRRAQRIWQQLGDEEKREARACYYASISEIDGQFGRLLDYLDESGQRENTIVVMTADHGDLLGGPRTLLQGYLRLRGDIPDSPDCLRTGHLRRCPLSRAGWSPRSLSDPVDVGRLRAV